jgi:mono/diheme cytochrome c family protein
MLLFIGAAVALVISLAMPCRVATAAAVDGEFFESRIRPVLVEHCHECHAGDAAEGGLRLDSRAGFDGGGTSGRLIDEKQPAASLLLRLIRHEVKDREMPQGADKLPDAVIADFEKWIANGLPGLPDTPPTPQAASAEAWAAKLAARRTHWAWQPVATVSAPQVPLPTDSPHRAWLAQPIDRFLLEKIVARGLEPAPPADRPTLIRRL